jgi:hypothetical protein
LTAHSPAPKPRCDPGRDHEGWPPWRAVAVGAILSLLTALAIQQITLVYHAGEPESSCPPVPAITWLLLLVAANHAFHRVRGRLLLTRAELLVVYVVLTVATAMLARFMMRMLLAFLTTPQYHQELAMVGEALPGWYAPGDPAAVREFFEGSRNGRVPWDVWLWPVLVWTALSVLILGGMFCLVDLFRSRWADQEHLRFPLLYLPLELSGHTGRGRPPFLTDPLMWIGFSVGMLYALPVIVAPVWPGFPDWRKTFYPFQALTGRPWNELSGVYVRVHPYLVGFGYLMSGENLFTIWAGCFLQKLFWILALCFGYQRPAWHKGHEVEQLMGGIVVVALWLVWRNRRSLATNLRSPGHPDRWRLLGLGVGFAGAVCILQRAGIRAWLTATVLGLLFAEALVYARIRAETGIPSYWATTGRFEQRDLLFDLLGARSISTWVGFGALANLNVVGWMTMGQFQAMAAYQAEAGQLGRKSATGPLPTLLLTIGSVLLGLALAWWTHLTTFYGIGALMATGSAGGGYWELGAARGVHNKFLAAMDSGAGFRLGAVFFRLAGACVVLGLALLRSRYAGFPLTPWGYMITCSYGATFWPSFLMVWILQRAILRYGGPKAYHKAIPFFLGISFGYMSAAVVALAMAFLSGRGPSFGAGRRIYFDI